MLLVINDCLLYTRTASLAEITVAIHIVSFGSSINMRLGTRT